MTEFNRFQRRLTAGVCEVPGCQRPTIGPVGILTQTPIVFPCAACAIMKYGTDEPWGIVSVMLGDKPLTKAESRAILRWGEVML